MRIGVLLLAAALAAAVTEESRRPDGRTRTIADRLFDRLDEARAAEGVPAWQRRSALDAVAHDLAREMIRTDRDSLARAVERALKEAGVTGFRQAKPIVLSLKGYPNPVDELANLWQRYGPAREGLTDPEVDAIGLADAAGPDGRVVLVGILMVDRSPPLAPSVLERHAFEAVNRVRSLEGLAPLRLTDALAEVARRHSQDMIRRGYFDHESPEGVDVGRRVRAAGIDYLTVAENISWVEGMDDPVAAAVDGWMRSAGHRRNILAPRFGETGLGVAVDAKGVVYFTQVFLEAPPSGRDPGR